ncbi:hypothetical protein EMCRGX_G002461 [Ephydatia muelleri]
MVGYLDMTDPSQQCPDSWLKIASPRSSCGKRTTQTCDSLSIPTAGASYQKSPMVHLEEDNTFTHMSLPYGNRLVGLAVHALGGQHHLCLWALIIIASQEIQYKSFTQQICTPRTFCGTDNSAEEMRPRVAIHQTSRGSAKRSQPQSLRTWRFGYARMKVQFTMRMIVAIESFELYIQGLAVYHITFVPLYFKLVLKLKIGLSKNQEVVGHVEDSASVLGTTLVGPLVLLGAARTAGGTSRTISGCGVESAGTEKSSMLAGSHSTSLDSVLSFSRNINIQRRILLMCTTLDLSDFLCSFCKVTGE